jgi:hypothetical protein
MFAAQVLVALVASCRQRGLNTAGKCKHGLFLVAGDGIEPQSMGLKQ